MRLLVVDDDEELAARLAAELAGLGHDVQRAQDGRTALLRATDDKLDGVLTEVVLPHVDGIEVTRVLRERGINVPIIILTSEVELGRNLAAFDAGADDYLVKPVVSAEIDARFRAIVRRATRSADSGVMRAGDIEVNEVKHRAMRGSRLLTLQNLEFRLLCALVRNVNAAVSREALYRIVWGGEGVPKTNVVESYVRHLRGQLNAGGERDPIVTVRGVGYMLTDRG